MVAKLHLPYPPSVNHYWRHVGHKTLISAAGRAYRTNVQADVLAAHGLLRLAGRLGVTIKATMPDKRRRDVDNLPKAVLDALTHAQVWLDDSQIDRLTIERCGVESPGWLDVLIDEINGN